MTRLKDYCKIPSKVPKLTFKQIGGKNIMPIGCFWGPFYQDPTFYENENNKGKAYPFPNFINDKWFDKLQEVGVNLIYASTRYWGGHDKEIKETLDICQKKKMASFVMSATLYQNREVDEEYEYTKEDVEKMVEPFINHPACVGIFLKDEPFCEELKTVAKISDLFYKNGHKDKVLAIDFAGHTLQNRKYFSNYQMELLEYILTSKPKMIVVDCYPFDPLFSPKIFLKSLSTTFNTCKIAELPMWYFLQCGNYWGAQNPKLNKGEYSPLKGQFFWHYSILLAYGVKGLLYFPTIQPYIYSRAENNQDDFLKCGILGCDGRETQFFDFSKEAYVQLKAIQKVLMNSNCAGICAFGDEVLDCVKDNPEYFHYKSYKEFLGASDNTLVGCFDYQGKTALYVVNFSMTDKNKITCNFEDDSILEITIKGKKKTYNKSIINFELEAGDGALIIVKNSSKDKVWAQ